MLKILIVSALIVHSCTAGPRFNQDLDSFLDNELGRAKREVTVDGTGVCKYSKGIWSVCNYLTKLETRSDTIRRAVSDAVCPDTRQITRNCKKDKRQRKEKGDQNKGGLCVYGKPKDAEWSPCQSGVRHKSLDLLEEKERAGCPTVKTISKKCKNQNEKKDKKAKKKEKKQERSERNQGKQHKTVELKEKRMMKKEEKKENKIAEKCSFGSWTVYSPCSAGGQHRQRQVTRGKDLKLCQRQAKDKRKC